ncbi:MAG: hypothetical protein R6V03_01055 [Kiritimatiellia bacterium]
MKDTGDKKPSTKRFRRAALALIAAAVIAACWFGGPAGILLRKILSGYLPYETREVTVTAIRRRKASESLKRGLSLRIEPERLMEIITAAYPAAAALPRKLVEKGLCVDGYWRPGEFSLPGGESIPLKLILEDTRNGPVLEGRLPVEEVNRSLETELVEKLRRKKKWFLGHYEVVYEPEFVTFALRSQSGPVLTPVTSRKFFFEASGRVKIWFEDSLIAARKTADVKNLFGTINVKVVREDSRTRLSYEAVVDILEADLHDTPPWLERDLIDDLRESLEKSLNRDKNRKRVESLPIPEWAPMDLAVNLRFD